MRLHKAEGPEIKNLDISTEAIEVLGDIVSEALDQNAEDPTIDDRHVDELVDLLGFLGQ